MASNKKRRKSASKKKIENANGGIRLEIVLCLVMAVSILLFISNLGLGGPVGACVGTFFFGLFGVMSFVFPFAFFFGFSFSAANRKNPLVRRKMTGGILFFIFLCAFMQLITMGEFNKSTKIMDYYAISAEDHTGGGIIGGAIVYAFARAFSLIGAYILTIAGIVIAVIIMTQRPILTNLGQRSVHAARRAKVNREETRKKRAIRKARQDELRKAAMAKLEEETLKKKAAEYAETEAWKKASAKHSSSDIASGFSGKAAKDTVSTPEASSENAAADTPALNLDSITIEGVAQPVKTDTPAPDIKKAAGMPLFLRGVLSGAKNAEKASDTSKDRTGVKDALTDTSEKSQKAENVDAKTKNGNDANEKTVLHDEEDEVIPGYASSNKKTKSSKEDIEKGAASIRDEITRKEADKPVYRLPSSSLLTKGTVQAGDSRQTLMDTAAKLQQIFMDFGVNVRVTNVSRGPTVTRYELQPEQGVKVSRILALSDDIKLNLATADIRIEAPIPGKAAVGIEVPNKENSPVFFRDLIDSQEYRSCKATLAFAVGKDIGGKPVIADIEKMPHLLIAGATGSGKSVCINTLIMSILFKSTPDQVRMLMIDPKVVELKIYDGIPHLLIPVVTDPKKAAGALNWAVQEMTDRYNKFAEYSGVRDVRAYNERIDHLNSEAAEGTEKLKRLPQIVIIVDELADLMMVAPGEVEDAICRLAQLARAAGLHLIIATQRPSVNVVTGLIKANLPSRIALSVSSGVDSRTILDMNGAEKLLGKGDMLFYPQGYSKPARVQGAFVSDNDITEVVKFLSSQSNERVYNKDVEEKITETINNSPVSGSSSENERDEYFGEAGKFIIEKDKASIGMLQRVFKIGFNRAARIMDQLCEAGVVGEEEGTKPRKILMTMEEFEDFSKAE